MARTKIEKNQNTAVVEIDSDSSERRQEDQTPAATTPAGGLDSSASPKMPRPPQHKMQPADFFAYLKSIPQSHWAHLIGYVYRLWPVINRKPKNIDKFSEPIDEYWVLRRHGSGDYKIQLDDIDGAHGSCLCQCLFKPRDPDYDPQPDPRDVVPDDPQNKSFIEQLKRQGKWADGAPVIAAAAQTPDPTGHLVNALVSAVNAKQSNGTNLNAIMDQVTGYITKANEMTLAAALQQMRQDSPESWMKMMVMFKEHFAPAPPAQSNELQILLLKHTLEMNRQVLENQKSANNSAGDLTTVVTLIKTVKELLPEGGRNSTSWPDLFREGVAALPSIAGSVAQIIQAIYRQPAPPRPPAPPPEVMPGIPVNGAAPLMPQAQPQPQPEPDVSALAAYIPQLRNSLLGALTRSQHGADYADSLITMYGAETYYQITPFGKDQILAALLADPVLKGYDDQHPGQVATFVEQFLAASEPGESELATAADAEAQA